MLEERGALALDNGGVLGKVPLGMDMSSRLVVHNYGTVSGDDGRIDGDVINYGLISPGNSPGILTITGDLTLKNDSVLHMEIFGPTAYDQLIIGGNFVAGGVLELDFGGYTPGFDTAYDLFQVSRMSGNFSEIRYLNLAENFDTDLLSRGFDNGIFRLIMASNDGPVIPGDPGNNAVPEPSSGLLIALGGLAMLMLRRRNSPISLI
ncbi:PEP-CTERM protein-sorting domain-containing protein [Nitrosomonas eutropha]|uniref:PEP-CTERM protein-sorting domain-containing protein n=2 Tax=Nitrosomonas eutropha TaxID=916 RepID=A0A1I7FJ29_9PROT|nr:PEP-CTERM protein-sorting domain-containing protein [Nitrosomonas eutropha]